MGALQDFLNANTVENVTKEIFVSDRFKDKDGNILKFKIKAMTEDEHDNIKRGAAKINQKGNIEFDDKRFINSILISNVVEPDFKDAESIKKLGCITPEQYISKVLLAGEIDTLAKAIAKFSGFNMNMNELIEKVKN